MIPHIVDTIGLGHANRDESYEIIVVNSGGTETAKIKKLPMVRVYDSPREGVARARNLGATKSAGEIVIFADAHLKFEKDWGLKILKSLRNAKESLISPSFSTMENKNWKGFGYMLKDLSLDIEWLPARGTSPFDIPFALGACMAIEKRVFNEIGHFDCGMKSWGIEDTELSMRTWLFGYRVRCDPSLEVHHNFRDKFPYEVSWEEINYNKLRFVFSHFNSERLSSFLKYFTNQNANTDEFIRVFLKSIENGLLDRRERLFNKRIYDDDWFFDKFPMDGI